VALAESHGFSSLALPLIGAGTGGGRPDRVLGIIRDELSGLDHRCRVRIVRYRRSG
jgi:O-acetyl-ADP-ribose deacetylase (regulator of RNase III)